MEEESTCRGMGLMDDGEAESPETLLRDVRDPEMDRKRVLAAIRTFRKHAKLNYGETICGDANMAEHMASLIADMMHVADQKKIDMTAVMAEATGHFLSEKIGYLRV